MPCAGCLITSTSFWDHLTETFINNITFNRLAAAFLHGICSLLFIFSLIYLYVDHQSGIMFPFLTGVSGHILVGNEFDHVQPHHLLLSKPKVRGTVTLRMDHHPKNSGQKTNFPLFVQVSRWFPSCICLVPLHQSVRGGQDGTAAHTHLQSHHDTQPPQRQRIRTHLHQSKQHLQHRWGCQR